MKRRDFLKTAGAMAAGAALGARAQGVAAAAKPEQIVVMTWGGQWATRSGPG